MTTIRVDSGYRPHRLQAELHMSCSRFTVLVMHRRFGKTVFSINHLIDRALGNNRTEPRPMYAYIAPLLTQAKGVAWDYLKRYGLRLWPQGMMPESAKNETELRIDLPNGARIRLFGADNPDSLRGLYFDGVVLDEVANMAPRLWSEVIRPALSDYRGWALFIGTPKGRNAFYDFYIRGLSDKPEDADWTAHLHRASETGLIAADELASARQDMDDDEYQQEFECSFDAAIKGAYWADALAKAREQGRICRVPIETSLPVHTFWDLGIDDCTAIWFMQQAGLETRFIDFHEMAGEGLAYYAGMLKEKGYLYGSHYLPHDVRVRSLSTGKSRLETLESLGVTNIEVVQRTDNIADDIQAVRNRLDSCYFDVERCADGLNALVQYRKEWDDRTKTFRNKPKHDWTSHAADAFRIFATGYSAPVAAEPEQRRYGGRRSSGWMGS